jgi:hypothetical protein
LAGVAFVLLVLAREGCAGLTLRGERAWKVAVVLHTNCLHIATVLLLRPDPGASS